MQKSMYHNDNSSKDTCFSYVYRLSNKLSSFFSFLASKILPAKIEGMATPTPMDMIIRIAVTPLCIASTREVEVSALMCNMAYKNL